MKKYIKSRCNKHTHTAGSFGTTVAMFLKTYKALCLKNHPRVSKTWKESMYSYDKSVGFGSRFDFSQWNHLVRSCLYLCTLCAQIKKNQINSKAFNITAVLSKAHRGKLTFNLDQAFHRWTGNHIKIGVHQLYTFNWLPEFLFNLNC